MEDTTFEETLKELKKQFPDKTLLTIQDTAKAYGFKNVQSIYNALRKGAANPFPVKPIKRCGKWYFNLIQIAKDQVSQ